MFYPELDTEIKSTYTKDGKSSVTITNDSLLPNAGLKARDLLDKAQMEKLSRIRNKRLKLAEQKKAFKKD